MFNKFEYVYAVYKEQSFTNAAKSLYISQPSLSAAIKNIERKIGAPLFERNGQKVNLTDIGKEYIYAAEKILNTQVEFSNKLNDIYRLDTGKITVGGSNYLCSYILPEIINRYKKSHPKIEVILAEASTLSLKEMIKKETIDIIIDSLDDSGDFETTPILNEKILLCVPRNRKINNVLKDYSVTQEKFLASPDIAIPPVPMKAFKNESFVLLKSGNDMNMRATAIFQEAGIAPPISFQVDQLNISYALAGKGIGACFVTDTLLKYCTYHEDVLLYNPGENYKERTLCVAYKKNKYRTRAMEEFIKTSIAVMS